MESAPDPTPQESPPSQSFVLLRLEDPNAIEKYRAFLKTFPLDQYEARVWIYRLLMDHPETPMTQEQFKDAMRVTKHILRYPKEFQRSALLATHIVNQAFLFGGDPDLDREQNEFFALQRAREELTENGSYTDRHHALMIMAWFGETLDEKSAALQEFIQTGDDWGMTHACMGMDAVFHCQTKCSFLEQAIKAVQNRNYFAQLLILKMGIMIDILPIYLKENDTENARLTIGQIQMCHANIQLQDCSIHWRGYDQYYMAKLADILGESKMAQFLVATASVLARYTDIVHLQKLTKDMMDTLMEEEEG